MADDPFRPPYGTVWQHHQQQQPQPVTFFGQPAPEPEPVPKKTYPPGTLICDFCEEKINPGEEALGALYGRAGVSRNGRQMVLPSADMANGEFDVHFNCLPEFLLEHLPEIADQIMALRAEYGFDDDPIEGERYCANCDTPFDPNDPE